MMGLLNTYKFLIGISAVLTDLALVANHYGHPIERSALLVLTLGIFQLIDRRLPVTQRLSLFQGKPQPSWKFWIISSLGFALLTFGLATQLGWAVSGQASLPEILFYYPLIEEGIYRYVLGASLITLFNGLTRKVNMAIILTSGGAFSLLHAFYGNLSVTQFLAGFLLAWVFTQSRTVWMPLLWHVSGNAILWWVAP